ESHQANYEPAFAWNKYKYVLNLPGHYGWSNRLKYLLLLNQSLVIDIRLEWRGYKPSPKDPSIQVLDYCDEPFETFLDLVIPREGYLHLTYIYEKNKLRQQDNALVKVYDQLEQLYRRLETEPGFYRECLERQNKTKEVLSFLTDERIYEYISQCIIENAKCIKLGATGISPRSKVDILSNFCRTLFEQRNVVCEEIPPFYIVHSCICITLSHQKYLDEGLLLLC